MKAVAMDRYGEPEVLTLREMPDPVPQGDQILVRVRATSVNPLDTKIRHGDLKFLTGNRFPKILGGDFAGEVVTAPASSKYKPGERVFGMINIMGRSNPGADAELALASPGSMGVIPEGMPFVEAGSLPVGGVTALHSLTQLASVKAGTTVLINGATGGVGSFAVQIGRALGIRSTAVCHSRNADFARELGADEVMPYDQQDFKTAGRTWDVVFDVVCNTTFGMARHTVAPGGTWITLMPGPGILATAPLWRLVSGKKVKICMGMDAGALLPELARLFAEKKIRVYIDRTLPLHEMALAHQLVEKGPRGKIAVAIE